MALSLATRKAAHSPRENQPSEQGRYQTIGKDATFPPIQDFPASQKNSKSCPRCRSPQFVMPRLISDQGRHTNPLVWVAAILCSILAIAVIAGGIVVFAIYMIYKPRVPYIKVAYAQLDSLDYDQFGFLEIEMALTLVAENDNERVHTSFSDQSILLQFHGIDVAVLQAEPFEVAKNSSVDLNYLFQSRSVPLDDSAMETMDVALKQGVVPFELNGHARTRWRVGVFLSLRSFTHLHCQLHFFWPNGSAIDLDCTSKAR